MKKLKVLLLGVFNIDQYEIYEELGISYIASFLREKGYEVMLRAATEDRVYHDMESIKNFKPDIVGLPVYNQSREAVFRVCCRLKQEIPHLIICLGGYVPTYYPNEIMEKVEQVDFIIRREGEQVFADLLSCLERKESFKSIKGLSYREGNNIIHNEDQELIKDLDTLPFPSRDILVDNKLKIVLVSTSRGCIRKCSFCCTDDYWKRWRGRDVKSVVNEIEGITNKYNINRFFIIDSSFEDPDKHCKRMCDIAEEMVKRKLKISYHVELRAEINRKINMDMIKLLIDSGLCGALFGIEAANEIDLKLYNKYATKQDNISSMELFRKFPDIALNIGFINFNPYTTVDSLRENLEFLRKYDYATFFNLTNRYIAFRGTKLYEKTKSDGLLIKSTFDNDYAYSYVNKNIELLINFLVDYLKPLDEKSYGIKRFYYYTVDYRNILAHCKRYFKVRGENEIYEKVVEHEMHVKSMLSSLSQINSKWFGELLSLVEKEWDLDMATTIMNDLLDEKYLKDIVTSIDSSISRFYVYLLKKGHKYELTY